MCTACVPYTDLTVEQLDDQIDRLSATFVGLPMVTGAPMVMGTEYYVEVARHQVELGVRVCADIPPIKQYVAGTSVDAQSAAGTWRYDAEVAEMVEDPRDRIERLAREQRDEYLAEIRKRRADGRMKPAPLDPRPPKPRRPRR